MSATGPGRAPGHLQTLPDPAADGPLAIRLVDVETALLGKQVLDGVTLDIPAGRITVIVGLSGAGKSVILRHMIGLTRPDRGQVVVNGADINLLSRKGLYALRNRFGVMFQTGALFDSMTVFDNVAFPLREKTDQGEGEIRGKVERLLALVGLPDVGEKFPDELSGGMVRRVALARAMVMDPEIIFFDEPTTGLDPIIRNSILKLVCDTWRETRLHDGDGEPRHPGGLQLVPPPGGRPRREDRGGGSDRVGPRLGGSVRPATADR